MTRSIKMPYGSVWTIIPNIIIPNIDLNGRSMRCRVILRDDKVVCIEHNKILFKPCVIFRRKQKTSDGRILSDSLVGKCTFSTIMNYAQDGKLWFAKIDNPSNYLPEKFQYQLGLIRK